MAHDGDVVGIRRRRVLLRVLGVLLGVVVRVVAGGGGELGLRVHGAGGERVPRGGAGGGRRRRGSKRARWLTLVAGVGRPETQNADFSRPPEPPEASTGTRQAPRVPAHNHLNVQQATATASKQTQTPGQMQNAQCKIKIKNKSEHSTVETERFWDQRHGQRGVLWAAANSCLSEIEQ